ncbi:uncharacterized protein LOC100161121 [Acyrthosiphon pisum]|uniref:ACYPI002371 protein n=1 Tax=Acyrthosiphon pisum TaxID=7029 RepID=C4WUW0_ACYPI|nr:uncharacterized protein LOC100161121 [Acyrthosiphon pisum]BAH71680.1 ACYPI002371 [Acyrthosiphon pisum]|eukprot:NP_001280341.1 uncharacterized protein LOC100161121 [Acyrthosiphon pisum]
MAGKTPSEKRLHKELISLVKEPPPGMVVDVDQAEQNLNVWTINMQGAEGTLYDGEQFQLQFKFGTSYPFESPEVTFVGQIFQFIHMCIVMDIFVYLFLLMTGHQHYLFNLSVFQLYLC